MSHTKKVFDTDAHFVIDPITRTIKNMTPTKISIMQNDHNSERFTFTIPRFVEGHDMLESDKVEIHYINSDTKEQTTGIYEVTDLQIDETDENNVQCSWLLSRNATKYAGSLAFLVRFVCLNGTDVDYAWNTSIFSGISVGKGLDCSDEVLEEYVDIIEAWKQELQNQIRIWVDDTVASQLDIVQVKENKDNIANLTAEQALLKARVDNLATMKEGSTTGDAELMDIRVGHDGTQYDSAGEAVRQQFQKDADTLDDHEARITQNTDDIAFINDRAIVCEDEGESIHLNDSSNAKLRALNIYGKTTQKTTTGKNLYGYKKPRISEGKTIEELENGVIAQGNQKESSTQTNSYSRGWLMSGWSDETGICPTLYENQTVTVSADITLLETGNSPTPNVTNIHLYVEGTGNGYSGKYNISLPINEKKRISQKFTISSAYSGAVFYPAFCLNSNKLRIENIQIEVGETETEFEEYSGAVPSPSPEWAQELVNIAEDGIEVGVYGKNLIPFPYAKGSMEAKGIKFTVKDNGHIVVNGTAEDDTAFSIFQGNLLVKGTYTLSGVSGGSPSTYYMQPYIDGKYELPVGDVKKTYSFNGNLTTLKFYVKAGVVLNNLVIKPQLEIGEDATPFELGKEVKTATFSATNGLPGIPVASGGNYTDASGQQWICDEIDLEKGVYVQRVMLANYDGSEDERWVKSAESYFYLVKTSMTYPSKANGAALSNRFVFVSGSLTQSGFFKIGNAYGAMIRVPEGISDVDSLRTWIENNPFSVLYELETPIETPLSEEEIAAYKAIHCHKTTTNIFNDKNAHMAVEYVADTKSYIDNKFIELQKSVLNITT